MTFGVEAGAPRDAGSMVTFIACPFQADYPEQREGQPPSRKISIDSVTRELVPQLRRDFEHLRKWRKSVEQAQSITFRIVVTTIVTGLVGAAWLGFKAALALKSGGS